MSEKIEFIPAKDLPVLEAETPDVLAVDPATGEMGRVPGANLGGGGLFEIQLTVDAWHDDSVNPVFSHAFDEIKAAIGKGMFVRCVAKKSDWTGGSKAQFTNEYYKIMNVVYGEIEDMGYIFCIPYADSETYDGYMNYYIRQDGEVGFTDNH